MSERPTTDEQSDQQPDQQITQQEPNPAREAEATFPPILPEDLSDEARKALEEPGSARGNPAPAEGTEGGEWGRSVPGPEDPDQWAQTDSGQDDASPE